MAEKKTFMGDVVLPWKTRLLILFFAFVMYLSRRSNGTVNRCLLRLVHAVAEVRPKSSHGVKVSDTIYSTPNIWFRLFVPTDVSDHLKLPVIVYIHGGAFCFFSPGLYIYDALCRKFALENLAIVVSVHYRLSPEHRYPAPCDDVLHALKLLDQKIFSDFPPNANLSQCFLAGDSAGGNIAHHVARRFAEAESEFNELKVIGLILIQPSFGGVERTESETTLENFPIVSTETTDWYWKAFLPEGADRDHEAANVFGQKSISILGLKSFPQALLFVGGYDPLQDWQKRYCEGMKRSGKNIQVVVYSNAVHPFYIFPELPETLLLHKEVSDFIMAKSVCLTGRENESISPAYGIHNP